MGFTFGKNTLDIEVCGKTYTVDPFGKGVLDGAIAYQKALGEMREEDGGTYETVQKVCSITACLVDAVLGVGTYSEIFWKSEKNFLDHLELASHLTASVMAFRVKRIADFTQSGTEAAKTIIGVE